MESLPALRRTQPNRGTTIHKLQSFLHADETQPSARLCRFAVKACAGILNREMNLIRRSPQSNFEVPYPTVFCGIMEGFLQNSEEAKRSVWRHRAGKIMGLEVNLQFLLLAEFLAEASHRASNT